MPFDDALLFFHSLHKTFSISLILEHIQLLKTHAKNDRRDKR